MDLMLTSYGLSHLTCTDGSLAETHPYHSKPPLSMTEVGGLLIPEYSVLLLCDRIVMDRRSYEDLVEQHSWQYGLYSETLRRLESEGFLRLEDFRGVIESKKAVLQDMLDYDLANVEQWILPLKESESIWRDFVGNCQKRVRDELSSGMSWGKLTSVLFAELDHHVNDNERVLTQALRFSSKRRTAKYRNAIKRELTKYLSQVNANLVLSRAFDCGISDWRDHDPFYRQKWAAVGRESTPEGERATEIKKLFEVSFPELEFRDPSAMMRVLKDKRIADLRDLVERARSGEVTFDREFANATLREALAVEKEVAGVRRFVSYVTTPIGFIPGVGTLAQKFVEEVVASPIEKSKRGKLDWYYLISEVLGPAKATHKAAETPPS